MIENGYIKLHRKLFKNPVWDKEKYLKLWLYILFSANIEDQKLIVNNKPYNVPKGSFTTAYRTIRKDCNISLSAIKYILDFLEVERMIERKVLGGFTHIYIKNWSFYNSGLNGKLNSSRTVGEQQVNINKKDKKDKKDKNINTYVEMFNNLFESKYTITDGRQTKLKARLKNFTLEQILQALENLSSSEWHRGSNDRGWKADPDFLIRSDEQVDKWLNADTKPKRKKLSNDPLAVATRRHR